MASKRAQRRKACTGKIRYADAAAAKAGLARLHHHKGYSGFMTPYQCQFCGGWHFGHPPRRVRQAIAAGR